MVDSSSVEHAVQVLRQGGLIALPTETVYGLGADASNEVAVRRIFAAKGRPSTHPLIVHVGSIEVARQWADDLPQAGELLARHFWPGPLTLVVPRGPLASDAVTGGQNTVGLRVPAHPLALALLKAFQGGIAAPSANRFGRTSPTTAEHVRAEFGAAVDCILDGGACAVGVESTIVDVTQPKPRLLRPGGVPKEAIEEVLGATLLDATHATDVRAPGMLVSHYAPRAGLCLTTVAALADDAHKHQRRGAKVVVIAPSDVVTPPGIVHLPVPTDEAGFAQVLYARLREADALGDIILAVPPSAFGLGLAVRDRLEKAAAPRE